MINAKKIAEADNEDTVAGKHPEESLLLALNHADTVETMVNLCVTGKSKNQ